MSIKQFFNLTLCAVCQTGVTNKKKAFEKIARLTSTQEEDIKYHHILDALQRRERIGNTSMGHGIAIPHARVDCVRQPYCTVLFVPQPIDYSPPELIMVDLIFGLIVPEHYDEKHLHLLRSLSQMLLNENYRAKLRTSSDNEALYQRLVNYHE